MTSRSIEDLHPLLAFAFGKAIAQWRFLQPNAPTPFLTATYRDGGDQNALFAQPTDKKDNDGDGKIDEADEFVTNAKAGQSPHNYRPSMAFDVGFKDANGKVDWTTLKWFDFFAALILETPGITWGGNFKKFKDRPHFELTDWKARITK